MYSLTFNLLTPPFDKTLTYFATPNLHTSAQESRLNPESQS